MKNENLERLLSAKRLETYYQLFNGEKNNAIEYYQLNTKISEAFYPLLANLEITLRNSIHQSFTVRFGTENWFEEVGYQDLADQIKIAHSKIIKNRQLLNCDKIVAELTFGFWTSLFNKQYARLFWRPLMFAFKELEDQQKHRDKIAYKLNQVRKFRNRIFHYEPICNDLFALKTNYDNIIDILNWLDKDLVSWTITNQDFETLYRKAVALRTC
jgi:hypothetical protein